MRRHDRPSLMRGRAAALALVACCVLLVGCREMAESFAEAVVRLVQLAMIALGLGLLAFLGMLGMTVSAFRAKAPTFRLVLAILLGGVGVASSLACVLVLDTVEVIEFIFALIPTPAVLWPLIMIGELLDHRTARGGRVGSLYRTLGFATTFLWAAGVTFLCYEHHGRPSWDDIFPTRAAFEEAPTEPIEGKFREVHLRSSPNLGLTEDGKLYRVDPPSSAWPEPGSFERVVTSRRAACVITKEGDVRCLGELARDAVPEPVRALAFSGNEVCWAARARDEIVCTTEKGAPRSKVKPGAEIAQLEVSQHRLFALTKDGVLMEFDVDKGARVATIAAGVSLLFASENLACWITSGELRCDERREVTAAPLPFRVARGAVSPYAGCLVGEGGELACWDAFDGLTPVRPISIEGKVVEAWPGDTFYVNVRLADGRFRSVDKDGKIRELEMPTRAFTPAPSPAPSAAASAR